MKYQPLCRLADQGLVADGKQINVTFVVPTNWDFSSIDPTKSAPDHPTSHLETLSMWFPWGTQRASCTQKKKHEG